MAATSESTAAKPKGRGPTKQDLIDENVALKLSQQSLVDEITALKKQLEETERK